MIVAASTVESSLMARRLMRWGARVCVAPDEKVAAALLPERAWGAIFVDHAIGRAACDELAQRNGKAVPQRFVLVTPAARAELPALKEAGFTGYLVKPVRAASLAARMASGDGDSSGPATTSRRPSRRRRRTTSKGLAILVAEDNEINALLARSLLTRLGHRPTVATSGDAAVDAWLSAREAGEPYAIVLMDVHMPGSDGIEATRRIRAAEAGGAAHADRRAHRQCVRRGSRRLHRRRHGRLPHQAARPRAAGDGAGDRRGCEGDGGVTPYFFGA